MITADEVRMALELTGLTQGQFAERVGVSQPTVSRWLKGATPEPAQEEALRKIIIELSDEFDREHPRFSAPKPSVERPKPRQPQNFREAPEIPPPDFSEYPRDVPVKGICVGGEDADFTFNGETVDHVRRPAGLARKRDVYALRVEGDSMYPVYRHGSLIYVDPHRRPGTGEDAVIELHPDREETGEPGPGFIKRVKKVSGGDVTVEQFNPPKEIKFSRYDVKHFHRVIPWEEVLGF